MGIEGQVAIVTGGGRGLGSEFAQALANDGAAVAVTARSEDQLRQTVQLIEGAGGRAIAITADVTDREAVEYMMVEVERQLGPVDLLVNNAAIFRAFGRVWEVDPEEWWHEMETNIRGPFLCARAVLPGMIARRGGRIINLASFVGLWSVTSMSAYALSKAAVIRLTDLLAAETKEYDIAIFAIHPGTVGTSMADYVRESDAARQRAPQIQQWFQELFAEGRDIPIEQSVQLILFLASGKADALSGRYISIDDDVAELVRRVEEIERDDLYTLRLRT
jgi:NAD(P)-dependent dehydrogenase (short-subunit alcohol dehydrogenase family)